MIIMWEVEYYDSNNELIQPAYGYYLQEMENGKLGIYNSVSKQLVEEKKYWYKRYLIPLHKVDQFIMNNEGVIIEIKYKES